MSNKHVSGQLKTITVRNAQTFLYDSHSKLQNRVQHELSLHCLSRHDVYLGLVPQIGVAHTPKLPRACKYSAGPHQQDIRIRS
jgi:hypothetical protein